MCLNGDIERQFEFVQQTWLANPGFQGLDGQQDPLISTARGSAGYLVPSNDGPARLDAAAALRARLWAEAISSCRGEASWLAWGI